MNFSLEPPTILGAGSDRMDGLATSTRRAGQYVDTYPGSLQPSDGRLFSIALRNHEGVVRTMAANIGRSDTLLAAVGLNLHLAQGRYDATEQDNVVTVNDIFTQLGAAAPPDLGARGSSTAFGTSSPADAIPVPEAMEGIPEWVEMVVELGGNLVSFSYWAMKILEWTIGVNPLEQVVDFFIGDWKKVSECGSALTKVGEYWDVMSATIGDDCGYLFRGWQGDAAGSAEAYFARLISAFAEQRPALDQLGAQYVATAWGIYLAAKGVAALISVLIDLVCGAAVLAAAIVVATASVVGAPEALAMTAALEVLLDSILGVWETVLTVQGLTVGGSYILVGLMAGFLSTVHPVEQMGMPGAI